MNKILKANTKNIFKRIDSEYYICIKTVNELINKNINNGFIKLIDVMPKTIPEVAIKNEINGDYAIVQAARVSYGHGTKRKQNDKKLINYLLKNDHTSPFEMVEMKWHVRCPIFVQRQWFRHRTANINEISGRYSILEDSFCKPEISLQSKDNKQGRNTELHVPQELKDKWEIYMESCENQYKLYEELINDNASRELARIGLPLNIMTEFYWKNDLNNTLKFLKLRNHSHAQKEIRDYCDSIENVIELIFPATHKSYKQLN